VGGLALRSLLRAKRALALLLAGLAFGPGAAFAQTLRLATGVEYTRGLYGARLHTDSLIATTSARYTVDNWAFGLIVPYVRVEGPGAPFEPFAVSFFAIELPVGIEADFVPLLSLPDDPSFRYRQFSPVSEGLGDMTLSASRSFELKRNRLYLDVSGVLKLPTGDPDKLIGTGETDVTLRSDLVYEGRDLGVFAGGGYSHTGKSERFDLMDRWQFSAGVYKPIGRRITLGVLYDWREPLLVNSGKISEITSYVSVQFDNRFSVLAYSVTGLSEASPDFGVGLRLAVDFDVGAPRWFD